MSTRRAAATALDASAACVNQYPVVRRRPEEINAIRTEKEWLQGMTVPNVFNSESLRLQVHVKVLGDNHREGLVIRFKSPGESTLLATLVSRLSAKVLEPRADEDAKHHLNTGEPLALSVSAPIYGLIPYDLRGMFLVTTAGTYNMMVAQHMKHQQATVIVTYPATQFGALVPMVPLCLEVIWAVFKRDAAYGAYKEELRRLESVCTQAVKSYFGRRRHNGAVQEFIDAQAPSLQKPFVNEAFNFRTVAGVPPLSLPAELESVYTDAELRDAFMNN